ncbi:hypothetical protein OAG1_17780 [Agarivorans sp. OAG1]|uniref:hypothetical protein n=1 Tax=Agarivorans sp. OAG1 TaxID=3082387 RepID=UPI002B27EBFA|nr:hypothetical protein OAG1_17780 [Agarivorans sp. OAG1]
MESKKTQNKSSAWEHSIPWFMTIISTLVLIALAWFLIENLNWFKLKATNTEAWSYDLYQIHIHHIHVAMVKRSVGLFSGFSALFIGIAVCFYSIKRQTNLSVESANISMALATSSPGIVTMIIGAALIAYSIGSKDSFPGYTPQGLSPKSKNSQTQGERVFTPPVTLRAKGDGS